MQPTGVELVGKTIHGSLPGRIISFSRRGTPCYTVRWQDKSVERFTEEEILQRLKGAMVETMGEEAPGKRRTRSASNLKDANTLKDASSLKDASNLKDGSTEKAASLRKSNLEDGSSGKVASLRNRSASKLKNGNVANLSQARKSLADQDTPMPKRKRGVRTNYKSSDDEEEEDATNSPAKQPSRKDDIKQTPAKQSTPQGRKDRTPARQSLSEGGLLALPAFPSPSSPAEVTNDITSQDASIPVSPSPQAPLADVAAEVASTPQEVNTPGSASRFLASRARSKLTRRDNRPLPEAVSDFPVSQEAALDLLSAYGFLRSFSQALYLSPFTLQDFLDALRCKRANPLMDCVHLVLMDTLRPRVEELLAKEGAWETMFISRVDWEHLDELTWPEFVLAYLTALHFFPAAKHKSCFSKLLPKKEYYSLPAEAKLEVLSFLCNEALDSVRIRKAIADREKHQSDVIFRPILPASSEGKATSAEKTDGKNLSFSAAKPPRPSPGADGTQKTARTAGRLTRFAGEAGAEQPGNGQTLKALGEAAESSLPRAAGEIVEKQPTGQEVSRDVGPILPVPGRKESDDAVGVRKQEAEERKSPQAGPSVNGVGNTAKEAGVETAKQLEVPGPQTQTIMQSAKSPPASKASREDSGDANLDECVLCGMEGNLLCCDGCPAAYHARCIGLGRSQLPEGAWYCPECKVTGVSRRDAALLGVRIGPLGIDPQGREYWFAFGSVLILELTKDGPAADPRHYGPADLHAVAAYLKEGGRAFSSLHKALLARAQEAGLVALLERPPADEKAKASESGAVSQRMQTAQEKLEVGLKEAGNAAGIESGEQEESQAAGGSQGQGKPLIAPADEGLKATQPVATNENAAKEMKDGGTKSKLVSSEGNQLEGAQGAQSFATGEVRKVSIEAEAPNLEAAASIDRSEVPEALVSQELESNGHIQAKTALESLGKETGGIETTATAVLDDREGPRKRTDAHQSEPGSAERESRSADEEAIQANSAHAKNEPEQEQQRLKDAAEVQAGVSQKKDLSLDAAGDSNRKSAALDNGNAAPTVSNKKEGGNEQSALQLNANGQEANNQGEVEMTVNGQVAKTPSVVGEGVTQTSKIGSVAEDQAASQPIADKQQPADPVNVAEAGVNGLVDGPVLESNESLACHESAPFDFDNIEDLVEKLAREQGYLVDTGPSVPGVTESVFGGPVANSHELHPAITGPSSLEPTQSASGFPVPEQIQSASKITGFQEKSTPGGPVKTAFTVPFSPFTEQARPEQGPPKRQKLDHPLSSQSPLAAINAAAIHPSKAPSDQAHVNQLVARNNPLALGATPSVVTSAAPSTQAARNPASAQKTPVAKLRWPFDEVTTEKPASKGPVSSPVQVSATQPSVAAAKTGPLVLTKGKKAQLAKAGVSIPAVSKTPAPILVPCKPFEVYENRYVQGGLAAKAAALLAEMGDKKDESKTSAKKKGAKDAANQSKVFGQVLRRFYWQSRPIAQERCGWCHHCQTPAQRKGCLMTIMGEKVVRGAPFFQDSPPKLQPGTPRHLANVISYMFHIEKSVRGLLGGPWQSARFSDSWRKLLEASRTFQDAKGPLMQLEEHLRLIARKTDWTRELELGPQPIAHQASLKPQTLPSSDDLSGASVASENSKPRRKGTNAARSETGGLRREGVQWYRGGKIARRIADWEKVQRGLLFRAARRGGFREMQGLTYSKEEALPQRTTKAAWLARVEGARTLADLALQVRELDDTIRWEQLKRPAPSSIPDVGTVLSVSNKRTNANGDVEYLVRIATRVEKPASEQTAQEGVYTAEKKKKKKATVDSAQSWSKETAVPLYLLEQFEERVKRDREQAAIAMAAQPRFNSQSLKSPPSLAFRGPNQVTPNHIPANQRLPQPSPSNQGFHNQTFSAPQSCPQQTLNQIPLNPHQTLNQTPPNQFVTNQVPVNQVLPYQVPSNQYFASQRTPGLYSPWPAYSPASQQFLPNPPAGFSITQQPITDGKRAKQPVKRKGQPPTVVQSFQGQGNVVQPLQGQGVTLQGQPLTPQVPHASQSQTPALGGPLGQYVYQAANPNVNQICSYCTGPFGPQKPSGTCHVCRGTYHLDCLSARGQQLICRQCCERQSVKKQKSENKRRQEMNGVNLQPGVILQPGIPVTSLPVPQILGQAPKPKKEKLLETGKKEKKQGEAQLRLVWMPDQWLEDGSYLTAQKRLDLERERASQKEASDRLEDKRFSKEAVERFKKMREERYKKRYGEGGSEEGHLHPHEMAEMVKETVSAPSKRLKPPVRKTPELEQMAANSTVPICRICFENYNPQLWYIACDRCDRWYHGEAFGMSVEKAAGLTGWKCRKCLKQRSPEACPYFDPVEALASPVLIRPKERKAVKIEYVRDQEGSEAWHMKRQREVRVEERGAEEKQEGLSQKAAWGDFDMDLDLEGLSFTELLSVERSNKAAPVQKKGVNVVKIQGTKLGGTSAGVMPSRLRPFGHVMAEKVERIAAQGKKQKAEGGMEKEKVSGREDVPLVLLLGKKGGSEKRKKVEQKDGKKKKKKRKIEELAKSSGDKLPGEDSAGKKGIEPQGKEENPCPQNPEEGPKPGPADSGKFSGAILIKLSKPKASESSGGVKKVSFVSPGTKETGAKAERGKKEESGSLGDGKAKKRKEILGAETEGVALPLLAKKRRTEGSRKARKDVVLLPFVAEEGGKKDVDNSSKSNGEPKLDSEMEAAKTALKKKKRKRLQQAEGKDAFPKAEEAGKAEGNDASKTEETGTVKGKDALESADTEKAKGNEASKNEEAGRAEGNNASKNEDASKAESSKEKDVASPVIRRLKIKQLSVVGEGGPSNPGAINGRDGDRAGDAMGTEVQGKDGTGNEMHGERAPKTSGAKQKRRKEEPTSHSEMKREAGDLHDAEKSEEGTKDLGNITEDANVAEGAPKGSGRSKEGQTVKRLRVRIGKVGSGSVKTDEGNGTESRPEVATERDGGKNAEMDATIPAGTKEGPGFLGEETLAGFGKDARDFAPPPRQTRQQQRDEEEKVFAGEDAKEAGGLDTNERRSGVPEKSVKKQAQSVAKEDGGGLDTNKRGRGVPEKSVKKQGQSDAKEEGGKLDTNQRRRGIPEKHVKKETQQRDEEGKAVAKAHAKKKEGATLDTNQRGRGVPEESVKQPACLVCGLTTGDVATCRSCHVAVHLVCYEYDQRELGKKSKKGWRCTACKAGVAPGQGACVLCPQLGGPLVPTSEGTWAHLTCAIWHPQTFVDDEGRVVDIAKIPKERWRLTCSLCQKREGACIRCSAPGCNTPLHPFCCRKEGLPIFIMPTPKGSSNLAYCRQHKDQVG